MVTTDFSSRITIGRKIASYASVLTMVALVPKGKTRFRNFRQSAEYGSAAFSSLEIAASLPTWEC